MFFCQAICTNKRAFRYLIQLAVEERGRERATEGREREKAQPIEFKYIQFAIYKYLYM